MRAAIALLTRSVTSFGTDRCATLSAAIAYRTVFALFPVALVGVSLLGFLMDDAAARERVAAGIGSVIALGTEGEQALAETLSGVSRARGLFGVAGLVLAVWSASGLFGEIRTALNVVWDVDRPRPLLRAKLQDIILFAGFGGLLAASTVITGLLTGARDSSDGWLGPLAEATAPALVALSIAVPPLMTLAAFLVLYRFAPHVRLRFRDVAPAALIATLFFEFGKNVLAYYILHLGNFNALAGSLGAAILFLVFVYYAAQVMLFAAEVAKHRLLVEAGTLPAANPGPPGPRLPLAQRLQAMLARLWVSEEHHHDGELPYAPARRDPATNRPTNTREEVILAWQQRTGAAATNGAGKQAGARHGGRNGDGGRIHVIAGEIMRHGDRMFVQSERSVTPIEPRIGLTVTRNGAETRLEALRGGDWATVTLDADGNVRAVDASDQVALKRGTSEAADDAGRIAGMLGTLALMLIRRLKGEHDGKQTSRGQRASDEGSSILRRKPSR